MERNRPQRPETRWMAQPGSTNRSSASLGSTTRRTIPAATPAPASDEPCTCYEPLRNTSVGSSPVQNASEGTFQCNSLRMIAGAASTNIVGPLPQLRLSETMRLRVPQVERERTIPNRMGCLPRRNSAGSSTTTCFQKMRGGSTLRSRSYESSTAITKVRYDRIHDIRWATRHLVLAELAERLLKEKRSPGPISTDASLEILKLIRLCEQQQRERLLKTMQEDPEIAFPRVTLVRWLVSAVLAGLVLGGGLAYLLCLKVARPTQDRQKPTLMLGRGK